MSMDLELADKQALERLVRTFEVFRGYDKDMPIGEAMCLIWTALGKADGTVDELARMLGVESKTTPSRYFQALSDLGRAKNAGLELVKQSIDPMNQRRKTRALTNKGRLAIQTLLGVLKGK